MASRYLVKLLITWTYVARPYKPAPPPDLSTDKEKKRAHERKLREYEERLRKYRNSLEQFMQLSATRRLTELTSQIAFELGNFDRSLSVFLNNVSQFMRGRVFPFLQSSLRELQLRHCEEFATLKQRMLGQISALIELNPEVSKALIFEYLPESKEQLVREIRDRRVKLHYIEQLLASGMPLEKESLITHIDLLAEFKVLEVGPVIKNHFEYPIQECLEICKERQILDALQFLYERMGLVNLAVATAVLRLKAVFEEWLSEEREFRIKERIEPILGDVLAMCRKNNTEDVWEALLDQCLQLFDKYHDMDQPATEVFYEVIGRVIFEVQSCNEVIFLRALEGKLLALKVGPGIRTALVRIFSNYLYAENILFSAENLIRDALFIEKYVFYYTNCKAHSARVLCDGCGFSLEDERQLLVYNCGHSFHRLCLKDTLAQRVCPVCLRNEEMQYRYFLDGKGQLKLSEYFTKVTENVQHVRTELQGKEAELQETKQERQQAARLRDKLAVFRDYDLGLLKTRTAIYEYEDELESQPRF
jgi:hypothetical protein